MKTAALYLLVFTLLALELIGITYPRYTECLSHGFSIFYCLTSEIK